MKLIFVVNDASFFLSHRLPLALAARRAGYEVHVATPPHAAAVAQIRLHGFVFHPLPLVRCGMRPWQELRTLMALLRLYRRVRPDIVHHVTVKPVIYGGIAARLAAVPAVVSAVPGLGYLFIAAGPVAALRRAAAILLYRFALRHPGGRVILQNPDDLAMLLQSKVVKPERITLIRGSGVDLADYRPEPEAPGLPMVVLAARMLRDKGIEEFVAAAQRLRAEGMAARFVLVGGADPGNPSAIPPRRLQAWADAGLVEWWGHREDMAAVFAQAHIVCLPSYREGLPKVLLEAAACGRAVVTTDVPGCREAVTHGDNGLLVPARDVAGLAQALRMLLEDADLRKRMGRRGRARAEAEFGVERVVNATLALYRDLGRAAGHHTGAAQKIG